MAISGAKSTQDFVPIDDVRDGIVVLRNGSLRAIVMVSAINFALKSEDEQAAILLQFQTFLNSLDFSIQFFIQSRELDIGPYISRLEERVDKQESDLMQIQVREYIEFVRNFTEESDIMTKKFFIVIPYSPPALTVKKGSSGGLAISGLFNKNTELTEEQIAQKNMSFEEHRSQLEQRIAIVQQGMSRTGVRTAILGTDEVVELFYKLFNPGEQNSALSVPHYGDTQ